MSICDFPRIHFSGTAFLNAPTGCRNHYPLVDLSTNSVLYGDKTTRGKAVDRTIPAAEYHAYLDEIGERIDHSGRLNPAGAFNLAKGWGFGVNGHFLVDAQIHHTQLHTPNGLVENRSTHAPIATADPTVDPLIGSKIEFWGHHNEYLGTTHNRARVFDGDPASIWTQQILVGRVTFGRRQESYKTPNAFSGLVNCTAHARWQRRDFLDGITDSPIAHLLGGSALYQLTIDKESEQFLWMDGYPDSPAVLALKAAMDQPTVRGLTVQFTISQMQLPAKPDTPIPHKINGTIGLWQTQELTNYPAGRLLIPQQKGPRTGCPSPATDQGSGVKTSEDDGTQASRPSHKQDGRGTHRAGSRPWSGSGLGVMVCQLFADRVTLNAFSAFPRVCALDTDRTPVETVDFGTLVLCTAQSDLHIATIERRDYCLAALERTSGLLDLPLLDQDPSTLRAVAKEGLLIRPMDARDETHLHEREINVQAEDANIILETFAETAPYDCRQTIQIHSFVRGVRGSVANIGVAQITNPNALAAVTEHSAQRAVVAFDESIETDQNGIGTLILRGLQGGTARLHLNVVVANEQYDNVDEWGLWGSEGCVYVRTLPDDWHLLEIDDAAVNFELIYREIFYFYELTSSFMRDEVFSLQDKCKVETYRRLIWQMSDPDNRDKTYYMPPTRDLSYPKAMLLYTYLHNRERAGFVPDSRASVAAGSAGMRASSGVRAELVAALRDAADLEILVMQQYLYAAYSIPNYKTGLGYVERGLWTADQLRLLCGDGAEKRELGLRGTLLEIAREEMIHFLVVNNLLMAIGEEFYAAAPEIYALNEKFAMGITFSLEPFSLAQLEKFIELERPFVGHDLRLAEQLPQADSQERAPYRSISELYQRIMDWVTGRPELFVQDRESVGGEHHLYLSEKLDAQHPDYQIQVYDVKSALFAINFITEQGEGGEGEFVEPEESHYRRFKEMLHQLTADASTRYEADPAAQPWSPAYPCVRNPTLLAGSPGCTLLADETARDLTAVFQECYWLMLVIMNQHFGLMPGHTLRRSRLMNASIDVMTGILRPLGELIMTVPSGQLGYTAGISFELPRPVVLMPDADRAYATIAEHFAREHARASSIVAVPDAVVGMLKFYQEFFEKFAADPTRALS